MDHITSTPFESALALALTLAPDERLRLIERVAASVEREIAPPQPDEEHWGQALNRLFNSLEFNPDEMLYADIDDPVAWVKQLREDESKRRLGDWGEAE